MGTQRIANPSIPVRFWAWPPNLLLFCFEKKVSSPYSSVAQLVEQLTVNQLVAGSSPARGAKCANNYFLFLNQFFLNFWYFLALEIFFLFVVQTMK